MARLRACDGDLQTFIASESSMRCMVCGWIGWPRRKGDVLSPYNVEFEPHTDARWRQHPDDGHWSTCSPSTCPTFS